jgi:hypothetical protein
MRQILINILTVATSYKDAEFSLHHCYGTSLFFWAEQNWDHCQTGVGWRRYLRLGIIRIMRITL